MMYFLFQEYPKLRELIRLKNEVVAKTAHPPMYLKYVNSKGFHVQYIVTS